MRRRKFVIVVVVCVGSYAGCVKNRHIGPGLKPAPSGRDKTRARTELRTYEKQLAEKRRALGLDGDDNVPVTELLSPTYGAKQQETACEQKKAYPALKRPAVADDVAEKGQLYSAQKRAAKGTWRARCSQPCLLMRGICHAARQICKLASYLDEKDAYRRCTGAKKDCQRARDKTKNSCRAGCSAT